MSDVDDPSIFVSEIFSEEYRNWMALKMGAGKNYSILFDILFNTQFRWTIPWDEHRASDGADLRVRFESETGMECPEHLVDWPCSFLEMLVALAYTIEDRIMYDPAKGDQTYLWFWEMLNNIGLGKCTDEWFASKNHKKNLDYIFEVLDCVMDRSYGSDGKGGLFPLYYIPATDMSKEELWVQANAYFMDRSGV